MFNAKLFREIGGINPSFQQNADYEVLLKCAIKTDVSCIDDELVTYRIHDNNNSNTNDIIYVEENRAIYAQLPRSADLYKAKELEVRHCFNLVREKKV